ncbi:MAG: MBL fold metallo-hydrolase [Nanoarchaeota archaeon]|nr:MBL fold metallo-hydrolase [Nanoarchaeota archaeon]
MEIGNIKIEFLGHSGFLISSSNGSGKKIVIDPYNVSGNVNEKADVILITHSHYDHCSIKDIEKLSKRGTVIVMPADCQSKVMKIEGVDLQVVEVGDEIDLSGLKIETVPAYNKDKDFHPKSEGWLGYLIKMGNVIVYHSGDSDFIPEMQKLSGYGKHGNEFISLLPVSGKYVMDAEEAADAASVMSPDLAIPMHYGAGVAGTIEDAQRFVELCKEKGLKAEILERI